MKKLLIATLSLVAAGAALADDPTPDDTAKALSLKSRGQVVAELQRAKADGSIKAWSNVPQANKWQDIRSVKSRAEVKAETVAAAQRGELGASYREDGGALAAQRTRAVTVPPTVLAGAR